MCKCMDVHKYTHTYVHVIPNHDATCMDQFTGIYINTFQEHFSVGNYSVTGDIKTQAADLASLARGIYSFQQQFLY